MSNPNQLSVIERLQNTTAGRFATAHVAALGLLAGGGMATHSALEAEHAPAAETSTDASASLQQTCVDAALVMPKIQSAKVLHPGSRSGRTQTVSISAEYPEMPIECADYKRLGQAKLEIQDGKKWRKMLPYWWTMYSRSTQGVGGLNETPTGHEGDWIYLDKGEKIRALLRNVIKDEEGNVIAQKTAKRPVQRS
jgi:hypothetical protein